MEDRMKSQAMQFFVVTVAIAISSIFVNNAFSQEKTLLGTKNLSGWKGGYRNFS